MDHRAIAGKSVTSKLGRLTDLPAVDLSLAGTFAHDECEAEDVDQTGVVGRGSLHHVVVSRSSLAESRFAELELMDVAFRNVTMANASWET